MNISPGGVLSPRHRAGINCVAQIVSDLGTCCLGYWMTRVRVVLLSHHIARVVFLLTYGTLFNYFVKNMFWLCITKSINYNWVQLARKCVCGFMLFVIYKNYLVRDCLPKKH